MPHLSFMNKPPHFESSSTAMIWFLSGITILLFLMLLGLIFMG